MPKTLTPCFTAAYFGENNPDIAGKWVSEFDRSMQRHKQSREVKDRNSNLLGLTLVTKDTTSFTKFLPERFGIEPTQFFLFFYQHL